MEKIPAESIGILDCRREKKKVMKMKNREKFLSCHDNGSFKGKKELHQGPHSCAKAKATTIRLDNGAKKLVNK